MTNENWVEAIKILRELIDIFPNSTPLLTNISLSLANTKSFDEAHQYIDQANKNEPLNVTTKYVKAYCFELEEKFDDAIDGYKKCLKINKEHKNSWIRIAVILRKQSKFDDALKIYKHIFSKILKDPNILTDMGITLYEKGEKSLMHVLNVLEPGIVTSSQKLFNAITKQPTPTGVVRETGDVIIGASTGLKPYNVDIRESLDYKISEFTRIRSDVFRAENFYKFDDIRARGGQVIVDEFINIQREAFRLQKDIYNAIQAAKEFERFKSAMLELFNTNLSNQPTALNNKQDKDQLL